MRPGLALDRAASSRSRALGDETLLSLQERRVGCRRRGQIRMLGAFDTYLLGYARPRLRRRRRAPGRDLKAEAAGAGSGR